MGWVRGLYPKCGGKRKIFGKALKFRPMSAISANVRAANARLSAACRAAGRPVDAVRLVAVAKTFPAGFAREAFAAGCRDIGENYLQEAQAKMAELQDLPIEWHFVGIPQARKAAAVARLFDWAHGVDEVRVAEKMSAARGETDKPPLNVFLQVNISREATKGGIAPEDAKAAAMEIRRLPHLHLRGLTAIPAPDAETRRAAFRAAAALRAEIAADLGEFEDLSMGMSADLEEAILEGATFVRLGQAIFGQREKKKQENAQ